MVAEVGCMARAGEEPPPPPPPPELVTRDFLGGCAAAAAAQDAMASDLDLSDRRDLVPGKMYQQKHACAPLQDLNLFPTTAAAASAKTNPKTVPNPYQSVCTIEKVKSALERLERQSQSRHRANSPVQPRNHQVAHELELDPVKSACRGLQLQGGRVADGSPSSSITTSSIKRRGDELVERGDGCDSPGGLVAAACSKCLLYVLISKEDPRCPRCDSRVPAPILRKKPRIDLNIVFSET